jgi:hypothetical protein
MCHSFGFAYRDIFGASEHGHRDASFCIDVALLGAAIDRMLSSPTSD